MIYCFWLAVNNFRIIYLKRKAKHCLNGWERCRSWRRKCKRRSLNELFSESSGQKMYKRESSSLYSVRSREDFRTRANWISWVFFPGYRSYERPLRNEGIMCKYYSHYLVIYVKGGKHCITISFFYEVNM